MERILNMILRRLVNKGVNSGVRAIAKRGGNSGKQSSNNRELAQQGQKNSKNLRQTSRILSRLTRF